MRTASQRISKLKRPPAVQNWVRHIDRRTDRTAQNLYHFAKSAPSLRLTEVYAIVKQIVVDGISDDQAMKCLSRVKDPRVQKLGKEILTALFPHLRDYRGVGVEIFKDLEEYYKVGADVKVPIRPTFVINDGHKLCLYFVVGWANNPLVPYHYQILSTIVSEAILSQEEFEDAEAVFWFVPRFRFSKSERDFVEWRVGSTNPLNDDEKVELFTRYARALALTERRLIEELGG